MRQERNIEFGPHGQTLACLVGRTCAWVKKPSVLMDIGNDHRGIVFEPVKHPIAMVRIDVHIGYVSLVVNRLEGFDGHATVIEDTETRCAVAACVMQSADRYERSPAVAVHQPIERIERTPNHCRRGFVYPRKRGGIAVIEIAFAGFGLPDHAIDIDRGMKPLDGGPLGLDRGAHGHCGLKTCSLKSLPESL